MIECDRLSYADGLAYRLKDISFRANPGSLIGVFGDNGSGKSTLLKMLGGSLAIRTGRLSILGEAAIGDDGYIKPILRRHIGVLFQGSSSDEKLSCRKNLEYAAKLFGIPALVARHRIDEMLVRAGLLERAGEPMKNLSDGMRRRLELYRTFLHEPRIVLLDEPTASLDFSESERFFSFLDGFRKKKDAVVLLISHRADEIARCDRVMMLRHGRLIEDRDPKELTDGLRYLRCTFVMRRGSFELIPSDIPLFDMTRDDSGRLLAKIAAVDFEAIWTSELLKSGKVARFSLAEPNLDDAYRDLCMREGRRDE